MYYRRNPWSIKRTALIPVNELLGNYTNIATVHNTLYYIILYYYVITVYFSYYIDIKKKFILILYNRNT